MKIVTRILVNAAFVVSLTSGCGEPVNPNAPAVGEPSTPEGTGHFKYDKTGCYFSDDDDPEPFSFVCGQILVGLFDAGDKGEVIEILAGLSGSIVKDRTDLPRPYVLAQVPTGSEKAVMLRLLQNSAVRYAVLNISGPAALN